VLAVRLARPCRFAPVQNSKFKIQDWCVEVLAVRLARPVPLRSSSKFKVQDSRLADAGFFGHELTRIVIDTNFLGRRSRPYAVILSVFLKNIWKSHLILSVFLKNG
jgi:hypothetical protein